MKIIASLLLGALTISCANPAHAETTSAHRLPSPPAGEIDYCRAFASKASEARAARQKSQLQDLRTDIEAQLKVLALKTQELEALVAKRENVSARVTANLVKIYKNVEPETAAGQLQKLDIDTVSEILQQLGAKESGAILAAMDVKFASKIVRTMMLVAAKPKKDKTPE
jgi:flagellar motility protein MotE (MotC chaperone)